MTTSFFELGSEDFVSSSLDKIFDGTAISAGLQVLNLALMSIAGMIMIWSIVRIVVATGHHGVALGKHSEVWYPIRFVMSVALLVPVGDGLSGAQHLGLGLARMGAGAGNKVWESIVGAQDPKPLIGSTDPTVGPIVQAAWIAQVCAQGWNEVMAVYTQAGPVTWARTDLDDATVLSADSTLLPAVCGTIRVPRTNDTAAQTLADARLAATVNMLNSMAAPARTFALNHLPPGATNPNAQTVDFKSIRLQLEQSLKAAAEHFLESKNNSPEAVKIREEMANSGWTSAGTFALGIASRASSVQSTLAEMPSVAPPRTDFFYSSEVYSSEAQVLRQAEIFYQNDAAKTDPSVQSRAFPTGADDSMWSWIDLSRLRSLYTRFSDPTESADPLSVLVNLGHSLLSFVVSCYVGWGALNAAADAIKAAVSGIPFVGGAIAAGASLVGNAATATLGGAESAKTIVQLVLGALGLSGLFLAYVLPLIPFLYWVLLVARFFGRIALAMLALPLWAASHLILDEEEGLGRRSAQGLTLLADMLVRPAFSVLSLYMALAVFSIIAKFFGDNYYLVVNNALSNHFGGISGAFTYTILGVVFIVAVANYIFKLAATGTDDALDYVGLLVARSAGGTGEDAEHRGSAAVAIVQRGADTAGKAAGKAISGPAGGTSGSSSAGAISNGMSFQNSVAGEIGAASNKS
jgi:conjugal transfer/type IV secretion protein DotA/TraY